MGFEAAWPWIALGIQIAQRHYAQTGTPITLEEAKATEQKEFDANKGDIAAFFASKGLPPPQ